MQHTPSGGRSEEDRGGGGGGGWMSGQSQSPFSPQQFLSCISTKAKAESRGSWLLHSWIALTDNLIHTHTHTYAYTHTHALAHTHTHTEAGTASVVLQKAERQPDRF